MPSFLNKWSWSIERGELLLAQAGGEGAAGGQENPDFFQSLLSSPFLLIGGLLALFYVMVLLPEKRKKNEMAQRLSQLKKNDRVVTIGGIHGTIVSAPSDSDIVTVRTDDSGSHRLRVNRSAIAHVLEETGGEAKENGKEKQEKPDA